MSFYKFAIAAGWDAANARRRKDGRKLWNKADLKEACRIFNYVMGTRK